MPHLEHISLGENALQGIPIDIDLIKNLKVLSLWGNVLAHFPASLGNLEHLEILDLLHNEMTVDEQDMLKTLLPNVQMNLSEPCNCVQKIQEKTLVGHIATTTTSCEQQEPRVAVVRFHQPPSRTYRSSIETGMDIVSGW